MSAAEQFAAYYRHLGRACLVDIAEKLNLSIEEAIALADESDGVSAERSQ